MEVVGGSRDAAAASENNKGTAKPVFTKASSSRIVSTLGVLPIVLILITGWGQGMRDAIAAPSADGKPELHYLVIDKSGSIIKNGLQVPIRGAVVRFLGKVPENAEVRIRLFDHEVTEAQRYGPPFDAGKVGLAADWVHNNYTPRSGNTRLYGTVGDVFKEVLEVADQYSSVNVVVLTDGDDDPRDAKGKPIQTQFKSWMDVEALSSRLKRVKAQEWVSVLYTISHNPSAVPSNQSGIKWENVAGGQPIEIVPANVVPHAKFDVHPRVIKVGETVTAFPMSDWGIKAYRWALSDGRSSTEARPKFKFDAPGTFDLTLSVEGPGGKAQEKLAGAVEVRKDAPPPPPKAQFTVHPKSVETANDVLFAAISQAGIDSYRWDFGDGSSATQTQPRHAYAVPGAYTVTLAVSGPGGTDTAVIPAAVDVREPPVDLAIARYAVSRNDGDLPLAVRFEDQSEGPIAAYLWEFGDGATSRLRNPEHTYTEAGEFRPRLTVTNTKGQATASTEEVLIRAAPPPPPMPLWQKVLLGAGIAFLAWLLIARLILKPFFSLSGMPKGTEYRVKLDTGRGTSMEEVYRTHGAANWFWPRRVATLGAPDDDIPLAACAETQARIRRIPFQPSFELIPAPGGRVALETVSERLGQINKAHTDVTEPTVLEPGPHFLIGRSRLAWEEKRTS